MEGKSLFAVVALAFTIIVGVGCALAFFGVALGGTASDFVGVTTVMTRLATYGLVAFIFVAMLLLVIRREE